MATLIVNPAAGGADDAGDYTAAQSALTPLKTIGRALTLAQLNDTINVLYAANANPADANAQTDVYAYTPDETFGGVTVTNKNADAGRITIQGVSVGGQQPKWLGISARNLQNWKVDNFQLGYDLGSGFEYNTATSFLSLKNCLFSNVLYTGGVCNLLGFVGHNQWQDCEVVSKLSDTPAGFMEGVGIRVLAFYDSDNKAGPDDWVEFSGCSFHDVQGEDAIQLLCNIDFGNALIEDCHFNNLAQTGSAHTDAIQSTGCTELIVRRCDFGLTGLVASQLIGTDGAIETLVVENNLFVGRPGTGYSMQFGGGVRNATIRHNTTVNSVFGGFRIHQQTPAHELFGTESVLICNNLFDKYQVDIPVTWDESQQFNNVISSGPRSSADINAVPEYGDSVDTSFELANVPIDSAGIDDATVTDLLTDRLGRSRKGSAPDCGCHESDPTVPVTAGPRAPFLLSGTPAGSATGVNSSTDIVVVFYPKPGEEIDPATVTASTIYVTDSAGQTIPAVVTLSALDEDGQQTITVDMKVDLDPLTDGDLYPLVVYTVNITDDIEDTEGSAVAAISWSFRVAGAGVPAIGEPTLGADNFISIETGSEAGAILRRLAASITAAALTLPDSNPTGPPVVLVFTTDSVSGQRSITLSGGSLPEPQTVIVI